MSPVKAIKIKDIRIDGNTQQRCEINKDIVNEYAESMQCGSKFPPVITFFDGVSHWLADGFHRFHASTASGMLDILAEVKSGTNRDATLYSTGANGTHGMRLTNADKRKAVEIMLSDKEWSAWSDRDIAKHCHVTHPFVAKLRAPKVVTVTTPKEIHTIPKGVVTVTTTPSEPAPVLEEEKPSSCNPPENNEPEYTELDGLRDQITDLQDLLASGGISESDAKQHIIDMRKEIKTLKATLFATESQRDSFMRECAELKKQCTMQLKKIKKLESAK